MFFKFKTKRKLIINFLLILTIWPFIHFFLAYKFHINHWKFFGIAMYLTPTPYVEVEFSDIKGKTFLDTNKIFSKTNPKEYYKFLQHRTNWGYFYTPDKLANDILGSWRGLKGIKVYVHVAKFDSLNARPFIITDIYSCIRGKNCKFVEQKTDT